MTTTDGTHQKSDPRRTCAPCTTLARAQPNASQGPLLARALTEIDRGIEAAAGRRSAHLRAAKALAVLWVALVAGGAVASADGPIG